MGLDFPAELVGQWEAAADGVDRSRVRHVKLEDRRRARQGRAQVAYRPIVADRPRPRLSADHWAALLPRASAASSAKARKCCPGCTSTTWSASCCTSSTTRRHPRLLQRRRAGHSRQSYLHRGLRPSACVARYSWSAPESAGSGSSSAQSARRSCSRPAGSPERTLQSGYVFRYPELSPGSGRSRACRWQAQLHCAGEASPGPRRCQPAPERASGSSSSRLIAALHGHAVSPSVLLSGARSASGMAGRSARR